MKNINSTADLLDALFGDGVKEDTTFGYHENADIVPMLKAKGYTAERLCIIVGAQRVMKDLPAIENMMAQFQYLAKDHNLLSAAQAFTSMLVVMSDCINTLHSAGDAIGLRLCPYPRGYFDDALNSMNEIKKELEG